jgi:hypothetical protein
MGLRTIIDSRGLALPSLGESQEANGVLGVEALAI